MSGFRYLSLCDYAAQKFGCSQTFATRTNYFLAMALSLAAHESIVNNTSDKNTVLWAVSSSAIGGIFGIISAEKFLAPFLANKGVGLKRGGQIVRATQVSLWAAFVGASLYINHESNVPIENQDAILAESPKAAIIYRNDPVFNL